MNKSVQPSPELLQILRKLERVASVMDDRFRIPGTKIRFGMDSIVGLVPGVGDVATLASHLYILSQAQQMGARKRVYAKMLGNAAVDALLGSVPVIGDLFDVYWKSNRRNVTLLQREIESRLSQPLTIDSTSTHAGRP